ncbi:MAG TPA: hypothetical protein PKE29_04705 [Phycisphaerales bacterium]|nr:hypothetical protein [Phycisphaerales bacterium]
MAAHLSDDTPANPHAIHALMSGLIDYAGLFPPAKLPMAAAVANYAKYLASPDAWMLGRFILPVSRLEEFRTAAAHLLPKRLIDEDPVNSPWPISAIADGDLDEDLDSIFAFNHEHSQAASGLAIIDAIEIKVPATSETDPAPSIPFIEHALEIMAEGVYPFFELGVPRHSVAGSAGVPRHSVAGASTDLRGAIAALSGADAAAKLRTGGITPDAIPSPLAVAEFIVACAQADVPFKATAGLHHAVRSEFDLTYEQGFPRAVMHGFLNVFVAAAMVNEFRLHAEDAAKILEETDPKAFAITENTITWGPGTLDVEQLENARDMFALSYGSCSFEEPVQELRALHLI